MMDIDIDELEDRSKQEIIEHLRKKKQEGRASEIAERYTMTDIKELMVESYENLNQRDFSQSVLKKEGAVKILIDKGVFEKNE